MGHAVITNRDDLLWLAGLCEGEATFDSQRRKYPRIRVAMTDRDTVGRVATLLGTSIRLTLKPKPNQAIWTAELQGERAAVIMRQLLPHMGARRSAKIAEILAVHEARKDVTWNGGAIGIDMVRPPGALSAA